MFCLTITACSKGDEDLSIGKDWVNVNSKVYYIDSLAVNLSTFKFDSISVYNTSRLLVGAFTDTYFGLTKCKSYAQLSNTVYTIDNSCVYDSVALILKYDNYYYNDTLTPQTINIHEVITDIKPDSETDAFYNTTVFNYNETPLASKQFRAYPTKSDSLHITLSDDFGKSIFDDIQNNVINSSDDFLRTYKGLLIDADENNTAVLGFSNDSFLRIYYTENNEINEELSTLDISFNSTNAFHNISSNTQATLLQTIEAPNTYLASTNADNSSFAQAGTGIATRIDIPNLENLYDIPGTGTLVNAVLKISLQQNPISKYYQTNDSLNVYIIDKKANIIEALTDASGNTLLGEISNEEPEFNVADYYIPITYFLNLKLNSTTYKDTYLAIYPKNFNTTVNRYIFNGEAANNTIKSKLEITYATYD